MESEKKEKGQNFYRTADKLKKAKMLKGGRPIRNKDGKIVKAADFQSKLPSGTMARVPANRRWFGNLLYLIGRKYKSHWSKGNGCF
jgi:nuclear GTP-binding protein